MDDFTIGIKKATNGYIIEYNMKCSEDGETIVYQWFSTLDPVDAFADFLRCIDEIIGPSTGRYSEKRVYIKVLPGDKHESYDEEVKKAF